MDCFMKIILAFLFSSVTINSWAHSNITGEWISDCNVFGRHSFISELNFSDNRISVTFKLFEDKNCLSHSSTVAYRGNYSTGMTYGEGIEFNTLPSGVNFTVHIQNVIDFYNRPGTAEGCGIKNWELNISRDVSGKYCHPFQMPTSNQMVHDIYKIHGNKLRFGAMPLTWDLTDSNTRPQILSDVVFHQKE